METGVGAQDATYDTMVKDDPRVNWYTVINPVDDPDPSTPPVFTLTNINGFADVKVVKSVVENDANENSDVVNGKVGSLLESSRKVVYTLAPEVFGKLFRIFF